MMKHMAASARSSSITHQSQGTPCCRAGSTLPLPPLRHQASTAAQAVPAVLLSCCPASVRSPSSAPVSSQGSRRQRQRLARTAASTGGAASQQHRREDADTIRENVGRAAQTLEEMVEEVAREMFASEAAAYLSSDPPELAQADAVRSAVSSRLDWLDANFLAALNVYVQSARSAGDGALLELLTALREEVLLQVSRRLPPAVRVLDQVLQQMNAQQRLQLLQRAMAGGQGELPGADLDSLSATCGQFIDDMEDQEVVADRALLARLCLVREDLRRLHAANGSTNNVLAFSRSNLPRRCAAFLKEVLTVASSQRRRALMEKAFREDWEGAAPASAPEASTSGQANANGEPDNDSFQQEAPVNDFVRPGRFLATLHAMHSELTGGDGAGGLGVEQAANAAPGLLQRLDQVKEEALTVLQQMQNKGSGTAGLSAAPS